MRTAILVFLPVLAHAVRVQRTEANAKTWTTRLGFSFARSESAMTHSQEINIEANGRKYRFSSEREAGTSSIPSTGSPDIVHLFDGDSELTLAHNDGSVAGTIMDPNSLNVVTLLGTDDGDVQITSRHTNNYPDEGEPIRGKGIESDALAGIESDALVGSNSTAIAMTVMVAWTKKAECANSNLPQGCKLSTTTQARMRALINLAIEETNAGYAMSGINARLVLTGSFRDTSNYKEASSDAFGKALNHITDSSDGVMDYIHTKRAKNKADIVALIIDDAQYCGLAWLGPNKGRMFSVTSWSCATGYYSFGHEICHNLGCNHDRGTSRACGSSGSNYGYREPTGLWRSVMGYNCRSGQCDNNGGGGCRRMPFYSNPAKFYGQLPTGVSGMSNNAAQVNKVAATVASYF